MTMAISSIYGLVFSSAFVGRMNAARLDNFLTQASPLSLYNKMMVICNRSYAGR